MRTGWLIAACALSSTPASAEPRWAVTAGAGTDVPLDVAVGVLVESPSRLRLSTTLGIMPGAYVDTTNAVLVGLDAYDETTASLIRATLKSSLILRMHVGWRPFARRGLYAMAGYGLVTLGGGTTGSELIEVATGRQLPATDRDMPREFSSTSTLHMLDIELGWEWRIGPVTLRAAIGGMFTLAAHTTIEPKYQPRAPNLTQEFADAGASYLDDIFTSYVHGAVITTAAAYSF
jgi:hypothetical protein